MNYGYEKYGSDFWGKVTKDAASFKALFYPFQNSIKKHTGLDYKTFRQQAFDHYKLNSDMQQKSSPRAEEKLNQGTEVGEQKITTPTLGYVTNYFFPYHLDNGSLLYLKSSYRKRPAFVIKDNSGEHVLRVKDISLDEHYSYRNGKIVYSAYKPGMFLYRILKWIKQCFERCSIFCYFSPEIASVFFIPIIYQQIAEMIMIRNIILQ